MPPSEQIPRFMRSTCRSDVQRRGIGKSPLARRADAVGRGGCRTLGAWVLRENEAARRFYERRGAQIAGERAGAVGTHPITEIAYVWNDLAVLKRRAEGS